ncbi:MAG: cadmium-translocating P-type ATPase [Candidatus Marinimicrobia bacterium]|nr:cadmium-translocating P-type ATPase [Candidatus Neomarinimicrobiota bacterium]
MPEVESAQIDVRGVDCQGCAATIEKTVIGLDGVSEADVNLLDGGLSIQFDPAIISSKKISETVKSLGYSVGEKDRQVSVFKVEGMDCAAEERIIDNKLAGVAGIHNMEYDLVGERLTVEHSLSPHAISQSIASAGFKAELEGKKNVEEGGGRIRKRVILTAVSGILILTGAVVDLTGALASAIPIYIAAMLFSGVLTARKGYYALKTFTLDMNFLMSIAVIGAAVIGEWLEGAMVIFLFSIAELLEAGSLERARKAIRSLMELSPDTVSVIRDDGSSETVQIDTVDVGDLILVRPGERIPLDGNLLESGGFVDQSPITGESMPVRKEVEDTVYAGSINGDSALKIRVSRLHSDSTISRIVKLVEKARSNKAPTERFVDKFSRYYTPTVVAISAALVLVPTLIFDAPFETWFYRSLVLLVVACPCALVISTPVTIVSGLTRAAKSGVLIKGGNYLEAMAYIDTIVLDKTGTVTVGKPEVVKVIPLNGMSEEKMLSLAAAVESASEHPVAKAIVSAMEKVNSNIEKSESLHNHPGEGAHAVVNGRQVYVGNHQFFEKSGLCNTEIEKRLEEIEDLGRTAVLVWEEKIPIGIIAVQDVIRPVAKDVISQFEELGIKNTYLLTGDNKRTAASIAKQAGIKNFQGELMPSGKMEVLIDLSKRGYKTMMVGDGVNDTPALAAADVGVAMGSAGSDQALETADVALMSDDLTKLPFAISLSKKSLRIVKENIIFALGIKAVFMIMAPFGMATLWMAVGADMGASLLVILNGMRVLKFKAPNYPN